MRRAEVADRPRQHACRDRPPRRGRRRVALRGRLEGPGEPCASRCRGGRGRRSATPAPPRGAAPGPVCPRRGCAPTRRGGSPRPTPIAPLHHSDSAGSPIAASIATAASVKWAACRSRVAPASPSAASSSAAYCAQALEEDELGHAALGGPAHEALVQQRAHDVQHVGVPVAAHLLGGVQRPRADEDREPAEERALVLGEQVVAPLEGGAQRAVPGGRVAGVGREHRHAVAQPVGELGRGEELRPRGGQLQGEGEAVEPSADLRDGLRVGRRHREGGLHAAHPRDEHRDRGHRDQAVEIGDVVGPGHARAARPGTPVPPRGAAAHDSSRAAGAPGRRAAAR